MRAGIGGAAPLSGTAGWRVRPLWPAYCGTSAPTDGYRTTVNLFCEEVVYAPW